MEQVWSGARDYTFQLSHASGTPSSYNVQIKDFEGFLLLFSFSLCKSKRIHYPHLRENRYDFEESLYRVFMCMRACLCMETNKESDADLESWVVVIGPGN